MTAANDPAAAPQPSQAPESTSSAGPASPSAIREGPPPAAERIPLPPQTPVRSSLLRSQLALELARLDRLLVIGVLAFAFLLASFAVRNSDFWMHLATGRLIAQGDYQFGVDPFAYTNTPYWVNHPWLFQLLLYGLATGAGGVQTPASGVVLVGGKALLVMVLAWVLLQIRRPGQSLWVPAVGVALAVLAMSPRMLLQPMVLSFLFLGLTLYLLTRKPAAPENAAGKNSGRSPSVARGLSPLWALPPLFVLWVNLDNWFLLGPATIALYLLGQVLQQVLAPIRTGVDAPEPGETRTLAVVLLAGVAACLINPHHYHAFTPPPELYSPLLDAFRDRDERLIPYVSPWMPEYRQLNQGWHVAGLSYFPLVVLGLISFGLNVQGWRWWRALIWTAFLLLSSYQSRCIGFFAIVAAPITALNLQDFAVRRLGSALRLEGSWRVWALGGRIVTLLALVFLLVAAWPGWLHAYPEHPRISRRVSWLVDPDPSLQKTAEQLHAWRSQGLLRDNERGFNYHFDAASYCAWFCPKEKGFIDYRFPLFDQVGNTFLDLRQALRGDPLLQTMGQARRLADWRQVFREQRINHLILNHGNDPSAAVALRVLLSDWQQWAVLYMDGQTTILGWNDPAPPRGAEPLQVARLNLTPLAFGRNLPEAYRAPADNPGQPQRRDLVSQFWRGPVARPLEVEEAFRYLDYYEVLTERWPGPFIASWHVATWSGLIGAAGSSPGSVAGPGTLNLSTLILFNPGLLVRFKDSGPPAAPLLAVRAARRGLAASPDYVQGYLALAHAYIHLWRSQEESWTSRPIPVQLFPRQTLRHVQIVSALQNVLALRPEDYEAHLRLAEFYGQINFLDLALERMRDGIKYLRATPRRSAESLEQFSQRLEQMQARAKELDTEVQKQRNDYELRAANQTLLIKASLALERGLAKRALDNLLEADVSQFGPEEADLQIQLLLMTGRLEEVREGLTPELKTILGSNYEWYSALQAAASGNYRQAGAYLEKATADLEKRSAADALTLLRGQTFQGGLEPRSLYSIGSIVDSLRQIADHRALRGLLALEEGDTATAADYFQKALQTSGSGSNSTFDFDCRSIVVRYAQLLQSVVSSQ